MTTDGSRPLRELVAEELVVPVTSGVSALAKAIAARHEGAVAVLFYGSCLREKLLDEMMLDFYLIVADYTRAFDRRWLAAANRLIPPNVFPFEHGGLTAKYAVLSEEDFVRMSSSATRSVSVWARFAQPSRLAWRADDAAAERVIDAVARAAPALLAAVRPCIADRLNLIELWRQAFALTYRAELRAERGGRALSVVRADRDRYAAFTRPALAAAGIDARVENGEVRFARAATPAERKTAFRDWAQRRWEGKALTLLRLAKASATYAGGIDYLAWKIGRHSGAPIDIKPWQRRWPLVGALALLPRLIVRGTVR